MPSSATETTLPVLSKNDFYPLQVRSVVHDTRDSALITFNVPGELRELFHFTQGQHLTLRRTIGGEDLRRSYSICAAPQDGLLRIGIKRAPHGAFSNWAIANLQVGDTIEALPPMGEFFVPLSHAHKKHYAAFAVGSGITPVFSLIKTTLLSEPGSIFTLFYGNRASGTVMLREELSDLKDRFLTRFQLIHVMTREHQDVDILNGRITGEKSVALLKQFCAENSADQIFLCGPIEMVEEVSAALKSAGFTHEQIKIELFAGKATTRRPGTAEPEAKYSVSLVLDGAKYDYKIEGANETVLDGALRSGIDVRHSCKSGVCATCRAKLVSGKVDMDANYALEDYEVARGFILTCQSYPVTPEITVDFDQDA